MIRKSNLWQRRPVRRLALASLALCVLVCPTSADITVKSSYPNLTVTVTDQMLKKSPAWREGMKLPISAEHAIQLAGEKKAKLVKDTKGRTWELNSVSLKRAGADRWYWLVEYEEHFEGSGLQGILRLIVVMDGTIVEPRDVSHGARMDWKISIQKELPGTVKQVLESLDEKFKVTFLVDTEAFEKKGHKNVLESKVRVPAQKDVTLRTMVRDMLKPLRVSFIPLQDYVEIQPESKADK